MINQSDITIVIPHLGTTQEQRNALSHCLTSLKETVPNAKKIIAYNDGFKEGGRIIEHHEEMLFLTPQGQCIAVNAAVATTSTPWILITNDDMVYAPGWFENLTSWISKGTYCLSPKLVEPRQGAPTFLVEFCGGAGGDFDKQKWLEYASKHMNENVALNTGFNFPILIKRELWDVVGGYDVNYDPWGSNGDSDLEYKIKLAGVQPYQAQNSLVYHFSQTSGTFTPENQAYWQKNWDYFIQKWGFPRTDGGIWEATFKIPTKEEGRIYFPDWEGKYAQF